MPIVRLMCRNTKTGATAEIAELTLQHLPDWVPIEQPAEPAELRHGDASPAEPPAPTAARKTKAAAATNEKE